jgi:hypothetical protein
MLAPLALHIDHGQLVAALEPAIDAVRGAALERMRGLDPLRLRVGLVRVADVAALEEVMRQLAARIVPCRRPPAAEQVRVGAGDRAGHVQVRLGRPVPGQGDHALGGQVDVGEWRQPGLEVRRQRPAVHDEAVALFDAGRGDVIAHGPHDEHVGVFDVERVDVQRGIDGLPAVVQRVVRGQEERAVRG